MRTTTVQVLVGTGMGKRAVVALETTMRMVGTGRRRKKARTEIGTGTGTGRVADRRSGTRARTMFWARWSSGRSGVEAEGMMSTTMIGTARRRSRSRGRSELGIGVIKIEIARVRGIGIERKLGVEVVILIVRVLRI